MNETKHELTEKARRKIINTILEDEKEYCFDESYTSNKTWAELYGNQSREEAYLSVEKFCDNLATMSNKEFLDRIQWMYGDKYDHLLYE